MNHLHKSHLVAAELARVLEQPDAAHEHYQQAISLARGAGYRNEEALAQELAGRFYRARGQTDLARYYLREARYTYTSWGALAKVADLVARYPELLDPAVPAVSRGTLTGTPTSTSISAATLDLPSVLQAAQAISGEIALDRLLSRLLHLVLINAGAQRGFQG
jgi:GAF domain-containing protein